MEFRHEHWVVRRVLVTGSRDWSDVEMLWGVLEAEWRRSPGGMIVVHGAARGADTIAKQWVEAMRDPIDGVMPNVHHESHPAKWRGPLGYNPRAGHERNQAMVDLGADVCIAFPLPTSSGTWDCTRRAERAAIPVVVHHPEGTPS